MRGPQNATAAARRRRLPPIWRPREIFWVVDIALIEDLLHFALGVRGKLRVEYVKARAHGDVDIVTFFDVGTWQKPVQRGDSDNRGQCDHPASAFKTHAAKAQRHHRDRQQQEAPNVGYRHTENHKDES